jgi:restriction endonuclease/FHA domain-containing protein
MREHDKPGWRLFEEEVSLLVQEFGYRTETTKPSGDRGIDVLAYGSRGKVVIQCKLFSRGNVGGPAISQLAGTRQREKAAHAICITTSGFTKQAVEFAQGSDILLLDGENIRELCRRKKLTLPSLTALQQPSGAIVPVPSPSTLLGRSQTCTIILNDPTVSRRHAVLERNGLLLRLHDCGSTNGSFVNGRRVTKSVQLCYEDTITLGSCTLQITMNLAPEGALSTGSPPDTRPTGGRAAGAASSGRGRSGGGRRRC